MKKRVIMMSLGILFQGILGATIDEDVPFRIVVNDTSGIDNQDGIRCVLIESSPPLSYRLNPLNWTRKQRYIALGVTAVGVTFVTALAATLTSSEEDPNAQDHRQNMLHGIFNNLCGDIKATAGWIQEALSSVPYDATDVEAIFQNVTRDACDRSFCGSLVDRIQVMHSYARVGLETTVQRLCVCLGNRLLGTREVSDVLTNAIPQTVVVPIGSGLETADPSYIVTEGALDNILKRPSLCGWSPNA